jgi:hypothetical protein
MSFKITAESDLWESRGTFTLVAFCFGYPKTELFGRPSPSPRTSLKSESENFGL